MPTRLVDERLDQRRVLSSPWVPQHAHCEPARLVLERGYGQVGRGIRAKERKAAATDFLSRLSLVEAVREAAVRARRCQAEVTRGRTIHRAHALVAATASADGAIVVIENFRDFPMRDLGVEGPRASRHRCLTGQPRAGRFAQTSKPPFSFGDLVPITGPAGNV
jgi:predicted nucleic acid-binding protein